MHRGRVSRAISIRACTMIIFGWRSIAFRSRGGGGEESLVGEDAGEGSASGRRGSESGGGEDEEREGLIRGM